MNSDAEQTISALKQQVAAFPKRPGVYLMRDAKAEVIYVGKAKDLRARVRTYFAGGDGRSQIEFLLRRVCSIEKIVTEDENQAFVLERDLITKHKPRYNIRLKDDKAYLSVRIDENANWPRLELVRRIQNDGARYFGPYSFGYELKQILEIIKKVVPLRTCTDTVFFNRQRPCLEYQIKRCAGPCCLAVDKEQYRGWIKQAIAILEGKSDALHRSIAAKMEQASAELRFEEAADFRDKLNLLDNLRSGNRIMSSRGEDRDVFGLYREERLATVSVLMMRAGRICDSVNFSFSEVEISDQEVLESVLEQYYSAGREVPAEILLPFEFENLSFIQNQLNSRAEIKIEILAPKKGSKFRLIGLANLNAKEQFIGRFDSEARYREISQSIAKAFKLKQIPRKVECVDISNFQGSDIVGAVISFFDGEPDKNSYKRYKISFQDKPNDFAAIYEVVFRRLKRGKLEEELPDLLVIDGGPQQLAKALDARRDAEVELDIISLAKMRTESNLKSSKVSKEPERIYFEGSDLAVRLEDGSEVTRFFQRLRDEAHRFVITFHREKRSKRVFSSALDGISGLGPDKRRRILKTFGSLEAVAKASADELAKAGRMPRSLGEKVLRLLKSRANR